MAGAALAAAALGLSGCAGATVSDAAGEGTRTAASEESYTVGVLVMAQAQMFDDIVEAFTATVEDELDDAVATFDVQNANGDQSLITSIARDFAGSDHDAFAVLGTPAVVALASQVSDRPIFAIAMGDPVGAGVAESLESPGGNVTGSIDYVEPALLLAEITAIHPDARSIGTVYDPSNQNMQVWVADLRQAVAELDLELTEATIAGTSEVAQASRSLVGRAEVVLVGPDASVIAGLDAVGGAMSSASIPLYTIGGDPTTGGVLASIGPDYVELGTTAGVNAAAVLQGGDVATTPFTVPDGLEIVVNGETRAALEVELPADLDVTVSGE